MSESEFSHSISRDSVPSGSTCEWCDNTADHHLMVTGGTHHNMEGVFCHSCSEQFSQAVQGLPDTLQQEP